MKVFNIQYHSSSELKAFIIKNSIAANKNILLQIFTGIIDTKFIENLISTVKSLIPHIKIIGSTTCGEILEGSAYNNSTILSFSLFEDTTVATYFTELNDDSYQIANNLTAQFDPKQSPKVAISFVDGLHVNGEEYIKGFSDYDDNLIIAGGLSGDNAQFVNTIVFTEERVILNGAVVALLFSERLEVYTKASFGWENIGKTMTITKAVKNIVYEIDNIKSTDIYAKYLGEDIALQLPETGIEFPLIIKRNGLNIPRAVLHRNSDGSLVFAGNLNVGDKVTFGYGNIQTIIDHVDSIYRDSDICNSEAIFVYSCMARKNLLQENIDEELAPLSRIGTVSGFFTYGEFYSSSNSSTHQLLNQTMTILSLSENVSNKRCDTTPEYGEVNDSKPKSNYNLTLKTLSHLIAQTSTELEEINSSLHSKVKIEVEKNRYRDQQLNQQLNQQTKLSQMVELIDAIGIYDKYENLQSSLNKIIEITSETLNISRVSIWLYNKEKTAIDCIALYRSKDKNFSAGLHLEAKNYTSYFKALDSGNAIVVNDAQYHKITHDFTENYLKPLNIKSMLDVPIKRGGKTIGVICSEQVDTIKEWSRYEINFSKSIAKSISLLLEIEQRERSDQLLREKTEEQKVLLSLFDIGDSVLFNWNNDDHWSVKYVSKSINNLLGYSQSDFETGKITYASCIHKDDLEIVTHEVEEATSADKNYFQHTPYRVITKKGDIKWVLDHTVIVKNMDRVTHYIGYITDVTEQRERNLQLFEQSRLAQMGELMAMIAHQWRQPLSAIAATSGAIILKTKLDKIDRETTIELADKISSYTQHLSKTIDDFRAFTRSDKERVETSYTRLIQEVLEIVEPSINIKNIHLIQKLHSKSNFNSYPREIQQVLLNIIKNAEDILIEKEIKDPYIKIETFEEDSNLLLSVSDNAGGVPNEIIKQIFDPYFSTKLEKNGTGLGLYMSRTIIEEHCGGQLSVTNGEDGAVFLMSLPNSHTDAN